MVRLQVTAETRNRAAYCLPADPAPVEESAAAEEQDHDEDDEECVSVHVLNAVRRRPLPSVQLCTIETGTYTVRREQASTQPLSASRLGDPQEFDTPGGGSTG